MTGYLVDTPYPGHVHRELAPAWLHAVATALGYRAPDPWQPFSWCELGCGNGLNALLLAAACPHGRFVAVDFNAGHVAHGRRLATVVGLDNIEFVHTDFAGFVDAPGPPGDFDFVVCHGVWSWVDDQARQALFAVVGERLAPNGLFHLGYMSHPGASPMAGLQHLLRRYADGLAGDPSTRAAQALTWLRRLADAGLGSIAEHPGLRRQLAAMAGEPAAQIAHEFLTGHWRPTHAGDVIADLAAIGFDFIGSATPLENIDSISLPATVRPMIDAIDDIGLRESAKDAARNQSLRRDLFQRPGHRLSPAGHRAALDALRFAALPGAPVGGGFTLDTRIGPVPAPAELFGPALAALAGGPTSFAELARLPAYAGRAGAVNIVLQTLLWAGCAHPWSDRATDAASRRLDAVRRVLADADAGVDAASIGYWHAQSGFGNAFAQRQP